MKKLFFKCLKTKWVNLAKNRPLFAAVGLFICLALPIWVVDGVV